jgi:hypothetical protein
MWAKIKLALILLVQDPPPPKRMKKSWDETCIQIKYPISIKKKIGCFVSFRRSYGQVGSRSSSVSVVTRLGDGRMGVRFPKGKTAFLFSAASKLAVGPTQ